MKHIGVVAWVLLGLPLLFTSITLVFFGRRSRRVEKWLDYMSKSEIV